MKNIRTGSSDPFLAQLAASLQTIRFDGSEFEVERGNRNLKNVDLFPRSNRWRVRLFMGGAPRVIGTTTNLEVAVRYADLARLFFWKYRMRDVRPPEDNDMNLSLAIAQSDLESNKEAVALLESIESHLIKFGGLHAGGRKKETAPRRTIRRELGQELREMLAEVVETLSTQSTERQREILTCLGALRTLKEDTEALKHQYQLLHKQAATNHLIALGAFARGKPEETTLRDGETVFLNKG